MESRIQNCAFTIQLENIDDDGSRRHKSPQGARPALNAHRDQWRINRLTRISIRAGTAEEVTSLEQSGMEKGKSSLHWISDGRPTRRHQAN